MNGFVAKRTDSRAARRLRVTIIRIVALIATSVTLTSCAGWRGLANVPLPGGPSRDSGAYTVYVQVPDTLSLNVNSRVRVADVYVGTVRAIELRDWVATLTLRLDRDVKLPANATAQIGQTSLLGSQHVELAAPSRPDARILRDADTITLQNSTAYPSTERTLASIAAVLRGGGIPNLESITNEVHSVLSGNAGQVRTFLQALDTFTTELNAQRDEITRAFESADRLLEIVAHQSPVLDRVLTEFVPVVDHFAEREQNFTGAVEALGRISETADQTLVTARADLHANLELLQRPLKQLGRAAPLLIGASKLLLTLPFTIDNIPKVVRGDYMNLSGVVDLTLSAVDNALLTGTGFSGALRALEQAWGRDPATMIPDVRFTPNPNDAVGGPLVERAEQ